MDKKDKPTTEKAIVVKELKLTIKQRKWVKEYLKTGNASKAAWKVYDCKNMVVAGNIGAENLQKLQDPVKLLMEAKGLDMGKLLGVLDEGLKADKVISAQVINKRGTGMKDAHSITKDFIDVPDHAVRHKYLETAAKWLRVTPENTAQTNVQVNFNAYAKKQKDEYGI